MQWYVYLIALAIWIIVFGPPIFALVMLDRSYAVREQALGEDTSEPLRPANWFGEYKSENYKSTGRRN